MTLMLADLHTLKAGTVLQKGKRKRTFLGIKGMFVFYSTPSSKAIQGENLIVFRKWLMSAKVVEN